MSLILVGVHIDKSVEEVKKEIELHGRNKYFKNSLLRVFNTDDMSVYDLSFKDIVGNSCNIDLFNCTVLLDSGFYSYYEELLLSIDLPLVCNDGLADAIRFVGLYTNIGKLMLYVDVAKNSIYFRNLEFNGVNINSANSIILSLPNSKRLDCSDLAVPINYYMYDISYANAVYIDLEKCNDDLILIPKRTENVLVDWSYHKDVTIVVPVGISKFLINNVFLNYYEHCKCCGLDFKYNNMVKPDISYITLIISKTDNKFLTLLISELHRYMHDYKGLMHLESSRFSDKDYVISELKELFSVLVEYY